MTISIRTQSLRTDPYVFEVDTAGEPDRPLVLLLHGFPQTRYAYRHQLPALAQAGYFAVAPDQRGYSTGARPANVEDYAARHLITDALAIASACGADRFHLVGHDWGGQLAWLIAAQHPQRVASLSVLSRPHPAAFLSALQHDPAQAERSKHHRAFDDPQTATRLLENDAARLHRMFANQGVARPDAEVYARKLSEPGALEAALHWYRAARSGGSMLPLPPIHSPTLYVWGDADATVGRSAAEGTAQHVAAPYRFEVIPGAGHFLTDQVPARVSELLVQHIRTA